MKPLKVKCPNPRCKYEWETKSELLYVTCPSCRLKVEKPIEEDARKDT